MSTNFHFKFAAQRTGELGNVSTDIVNILTTYSRAANKHVSMAKGFPAVAAQLDIAVLIGVEDGKKVFAEKKDNIMGVWLDHADSIRGIQKNRKGFSTQGSKWYRTIAYANMFLTLQVLGGRFLMQPLSIVSEVISVVTRVNPYKLISAEVRKIAMTAELLGVKPKTVQGRNIQKILDDNNKIIDVKLKK